MALTKGFSLIETLVAITIASIAAMALMRVISYSSSTSINAIKHFDSSIMMNLAAGSVNESLNGRIMSVDEIVNERYHIDHPVIREALQATAYEIRFLSKESIDPLMATTVGVSGSTATPNAMAIQKIILQNTHERKSFFRITSDNR
ncbi:type IV pilus modification PilV family protein [Sulfuricurvum sp.]|uniref:type IV pilus modification PilV family protein n=1 Tax=Sulfuricurvum sp. TaxID=2025608 RepID=UPI003BB4B875